MNRDDFLDRLRALKIRQVKFASMTGIDRTTVARWGVVNSFPKWAILLLECLEELHQLKEPKS